MKKRRISHPDEEDPGAICALLGAMKLNVWVARKAIPSDWNKKKRKSRVWQGSHEEGKEEEGVNLVMYLFFHSLRREKGCNRYRFCLIGYWCCAAAPPSSSLLPCLMGPSWSLANYLVTV